MILSHSLDSMSGTAKLFTFLPPEKNRWSELSSRRRRNPNQNSRKSEPSLLLHIVVSAQSGLLIGRVQVDISVLYSHHLRSFLPARFSRQFCYPVLSCYLLYCTHTSVGSSSLVTTQDSFGDLTLTSLQSSLFFSQPRYQPAGPHNGSQCSH